MKHGLRLFSSGLIGNVSTQEARAAARTHDGGPPPPPAHASPAELAEHARTIEHLIQKLDRRGAHITPTEEARAHVLKRLRLVVKDRLESIHSN